MLRHPRYHISAGEVSAVTWAEMADVFARCHGERPENPCPVADFPTILREREPSYQGKPLSSWLENDDGSLEAEQNAQRAVEKVGTNSIPTLLTILRQSDSPLKRRVMDLAQRQRFIKVHWTPAEMRNSGAWVGFSTLGSNAAGATPLLMEIYGLEASEASQRYVVRSLAAIGPAANAAILITGTL